MEAKANSDLEKAELARAKARLAKEQSYWETFQAKLEEFKLQGLGLQQEQLDKERQGQRKAMSATRTFFPLRDLGTSLMVGPSQRLPSTSFAMTRASPWTQCTKCTGATALSLGMTRRLACKLQSKSTQHRLHPALRQAACWWLLRIAERGGMSTTRRRPSRPPTRPGRSWLTPTIACLFEKFTLPSTPPPSRCSPSALGCTSSSCASQTKAAATRC